MDTTLIENKSGQNSSYRSKLGIFQLLMIDK